MSTVLCTLYGVPHYYLGPSLPAKELAYVAATLKLNVVILGTTAIPESLLAEPLKKYFQQLDQALHFPCEIWIGGDGVWDYSSLEFKHSIRFFSTLDQLDRTLRDLALL